MQVSDTASRQKWCPFIRISTGRYEVATNRHGDNIWCRGTGCMAWVAVGTYQHEQTGRCGLVKEGV